MLPKLVLLLALVGICTATFATSIFYCGFGGDFCGQSDTDDVNPNAEFVILAFVNTNPDGSVTMDEANFPAVYANQWQESGKKLIISVGGQNGNWDYVFASPATVSTFIASLVDIVQRYQFDGVDLDIESYRATPRTVASMIIDLKSALGSKILIVSPEDITVYQGTTVPDADTAGIYWNYFVPIINLADSSIDFYQPQAYNNWYDSLSAGSIAYLKDVYENWRNLPDEAGGSPLPNFSGVSGDKLLIGVMASPNAGNSAYYYTPDTIVEFKSWILGNGHSLKGFMLWDSHWDSDNGLVISNACGA